MREAAQLLARGTRRVVALWGPREPPGLDARTRALEEQDATNVRSDDSGGQGCPPTDWGGLRKFVTVRDCRMESRTPGRDCGFCAVLGFSAD